MSVPAAGDAEHRRAVGKAPMGQHEAHIFALRSQFERHFRCHRRIFVPGVAQQARRLAAGHAAMGGDAVRAPAVFVGRLLDVRAEFGVAEVLLAGGVAANALLREEMARRVPLPVRIPPPHLCTDNGAMVAALGAEMVARGRTPSQLDLPADSSMRVELVLA